MTELPVLMKKTRSRATKECPNCRTMTKNLGAHQRGATCQATLTGADRDLVIRAGAHGASEHTLEPVARFHGRTTDLDIARLLRHLEGGMEVYAGGERWFITTEPNPFVNSHLGAIIREGLRVGLLIDASPDRLIAAPVHARAAGNLAAPACGAEALRYRLLGGRHLWLVDCEACLDLPVSAVSYLTHE